MSDQRRYDENEIAEILERATQEDSAATPSTGGGSRGLTLAELQDIGSEVGIAPARIAEAAKAFGSPDSVGASKTFLGAPRSVSRIVRIPRALDEDEWTRLVVDLRETFGAVGNVKIQGRLRSWNNGNLQVHVEPDGEAYRVRMRTLKGRTGPAVAIGTFFTFVSALLLIMTLLGGGNIRDLVMALAYGVAGVGQLAYTRATLPGWALERAGQMEGLAERIPLLLKE